MFLAILTLLSALSISAIAAFYSIVGLATIFPGAYWPVVAMGSALEAGKLVCASWLYRNWHNTNKALRSYLFSAVIVLCLITSMGIFGFLSKAHLQTNFQSNNNSQQISIINSQIKSEQDVIERQQEIIKRNSGASGGSAERISQLRDRIKQLDREVEAYTSQGATSTFFNDKVAKGIELKNQQKAERDAIDREIKQLTTANQGNNSAAEAQIARSQQRIQQLINQRAPLQSAQVKIDAEIGPIKYIGALAVDVGLAKAVDVEAAVRWVIIIIIFVFDPLAVLMLVAANQSFAQKFPTLLAKPKEIIDLERPDLDAPPAPKVEPKVQEWNEFMDKAKAELAREEAEAKIKDWQEKLSKFNEKVKQTETKPTETAPIKEEVKTQFSVSYVIKDAVEIRTAEPESEKKRPEEVIALDNAYERIKPDLTEVIEPENKSLIGKLGQVFVKKNKPVKIEKKVEQVETIEEVKLPMPDPAESDKTLKIFHSIHGKFQNATDEDLKKERDELNRAAFLEVYPVTAEDSRNHPPITASRRAFFQDYVDDVLRGNTTADQLPPEVARTVALILSEHPDPAITEPKNTAVEQTGLSTMTTQQFKEVFGLEPKVEDRDITDQELDKLIEGFEEDNPDLKEFDIVIKDGKKIRVPKKAYIQNEEQAESNGWSKILEIKEPKKNEIILPPIKSIDEKDIPVNIQPEIVLPIERITKHKKKMLSDNEYRQRIGDRINNLITKLEQGEIGLADLPEQDQKIIMEIFNSNG
jgi:hypothetical protein